MENTVCLKRLLLYVPSTSSLTEELSNLNPEETELVLHVGLEALQRAKRSVLDTSHADILQESKQKYETEIAELQKETWFQKERVKTMESEQESYLQKRLKDLKEVYESMTSSHQKEREEMRVRLSQLAADNASLQQRLAGLEKETDLRVQQEALKKVQRELDTMRQMLAEKDKQITTHRDLFERSMSKIDTVTQKREVASIGKIGEGQFRELALQTFRDFEGFELREVCSIGGLGDFHLQFKDLSVLVDSKLYTHKVNSTSREKIKRDLLNNEHMQFAWLVSMDTYIERFDKARFMFEWVNTEKCVVYINSLSTQEEPGEVLRSVWYCCKAIRQMMETEGAERGELSLLKEREMKVRDILSKMSKSHRERDTLMGQLKKNFEKTDEFMREMLNEETAVIVNDFYRVVVEWWNSRLEEVGNTEASTAIKSNVLWTQFKKENPNMQTEMDVGMFKEILCGFLGGDKVVKPKTKGGALDIHGYRLKP